MAGTRSIFGNALMNVGFQVLPVGVALVFLPVGIEALGNTVFGLYSLCATMLVLCNLASFGLAPAITREVARAGEDDLHAARVVGYGTVLMTVLALGILGSLLMISHVPDLLLSHEDRGYRELAGVLLRVTAAIIPLAFLSITFRAVLEGLHLFKFTALNRAILNSFLIGAPALAVYPGINAIVALQIVGVAYGASVLSLGWVVLGRFQWRDALGDPDSGVLLTLIHSGGWIGVSSLLMVSLAYVDRFIIARFGDLSAVTYYVTVFDLVTRLSIISGGTTAVLFPAISYWNETRQSEHIATSLLTTYKAIALVISIIVVGAVVLASELLTLWLGADFASQSALLLQVISVGVLFNSLAAIPYRALIAVGRARYVALVYAVMAVLHGLLTLWAVQRVGALGAAITYGLRALAELLVLSWAISCGGREIRLPVRAGTLSLAAGITGAAVAGGFAAASLAVAPKIAVAGMTFLGLLLVYYHFILSIRERQLLASRLRHLLRV